MFKAVFRTVFICETLSSFFGLCTVIASAYGLWFYILQAAEVLLSAALMLDKLFMSAVKLHCTIHFISPYEVPSQ